MTIFWMRIWAKSPASWRTAFHTTYSSLEKSGSIVKSILKVYEVYQNKTKDLNAFDLKEATKIICGSARSMGIEVKE